MPRAGWVSQVQAPAPCPVSGRCRARSSNLSCVPGAQGPRSRRASAVPEILNTYEPSWPWLRCVARGKLIRKSELRGASSCTYVALACATLLCARRGRPGATLWSPVPWPRPPRSSAGAPVGARRAVAIMLGEVRSGCVGLRAECRHLAARGLESSPQARSAQPR